jgi:hypothetical protein
MSRTQTIRLGILAALLITIAVIVAVFFSPTSGTGHVGKPEPVGVVPTGAGVQ